MKNLYRVITWDQACIQFEEHVLPAIIDQYEQDGKPDWPARSEAWNDWTDSLCKNGQISDWQYANWSHSPLCGD
tara:strand:+ start:634 stop:855 length:222 start_codon:yes stop_codon:yes gene_type:complete